MSAFNNSTFNSQLRLVDTTTGATMNMGMITGGLAQFGWGSIQQPLLSVGESISEKIKIYPNPADDLLFLYSVDHIESISIYTMQGQLVYEQTIDSLDTTVEIGSLNAGPYLLSVVINGKMAFFKFLKL